MKNNNYNGLMFMTVSSWTQLLSLPFFFFLLGGDFQIVLVRFCYSRIELKEVFSGKPVATVHLQLGKSRHREIVVCS